MKKLAKKLVKFGFSLLATSGTARFSGALGVETFMKNTSMIEFTKKRSPEGFFTSNRVQTRTSCR